MRVSSNPLEERVRKHLAASIPHLMRLALQDYGRRPYRLQVVPDGEKALAYLRQEGVYAGMPCPDLLLDIGLPKLGG